MNDITNGVLPVLDRSQVEAVLARVAVAAFTYYPEKPTEELGYTVEEDVEWSLEPARALGLAELVEWRARVAAAISDPSMDRRAFLADLLLLAEA